MGSSTDTAISRLDSHISHQHLPNEDIRKTDELFNLDDKISPTKGIKVALVNQTSQHGAQCSMLRAYTHR